MQGRHAHRYQWTDGVRNIATWFVEAGDRVLEIHADDEPHAEAGAELVQGTILLQHVTLEATSLAGSTPMKTRFRTCGPSVEPPGLQVAGALDETLWKRWHDAFVAAMEGLAVRSD